METVKSLTMTICFVGIAITMLDIITPGEKLKKQMRVVYSLVILLTVATPIVRGDIKLDFSDITAIESTQAYIEVEEAYQKSLENQFVENIRLAIEQKLLVKNINAEEILISINKEDNNCISISEVNIVLAVQDINKSSEAISIVQNELGNLPVNIKTAEASNG